MRNYICLIFIIFLGCENYLLPKQSGYLRLDYPSPEYATFGVDKPGLPFFFDTNNMELKLKSGYTGRIPKKYLPTYFRSLYK